MSSIDERVVQMKFDTSLFQKGVQTTLSLLDKLNQNLQMKGAGKGIDEVGAKAGKVNFDGMTNGIQGVSDKLKAMSVVGIAALASLTTKAVDAGMNLAKSLAIAPITDGFKEYELKMGSIQTILANTQKDGTKLKDVSAALGELNTYADKTIYNFGDMTKNIGLFTNAGIKLKPAVAMIQGFSNEAASSGTNAQQAAGAAYQLSQALSKGKVTLEDWRSLTNASMGNKNMQNDLIALAKGMGTFEGKGTDATKASKDFNGSLEKGWLTADVMSEYLQIMAKDFAHMTDKQKAAEVTRLKGLGLDQKEIDGLIAKQKTAQEAATKVRTLTQLMGTLKESIGSGWADTFEQVFGNFDEATVSFTNFSNMFGDVAQHSADARKKLITDWKNSGGRVALVDGLTQAFKNLFQLWNTVKSAFKEIFPPATGKQLADLTKSFKQFMINLQMTPATVEKVKTIFKGIFAAFSIGISIIKEIGGVIKRVFGSMGDSAGGFTDFLVKVSNWLVGLDKAIKKGEDFGKFFDRLGDMILVPVEALKQLPALIKGLFNGGVNSKGVESAMDRIGQRTDAVKNMFGKLADAWDTIKSKFAGVANFFAPLGQAFSDLFGRLKDAIQSSIKTGDFSGVLDTINTGLFGGLVLIFKKFLSNGVNVDLGGGMLSKIGDAFEGLTGNLEAMQTKVKADAILKIAGAVGILAASIVVISLIDSAKLAQATGAIVGLFAGLMASMKLMDQLSGLKGAVKMPLIAAGLIGLSVAVLILSVAMKNLDGLDWEGTAKGLSGIIGLLVGLSGATQLMAKNNKGMVTAGIGLMAVAVAIKILVSAVKDFSTMDWGSMAKGLTGVGTLLGALGIFTKFADANKMGISNGVGLILLAASLKIMYSVVKDFASMDWVSMGKGLAGMAGALAIVAGAMNVMPKNMLVSAAGLVVVAGALKIVASVLGTLGGMTWDEIAHGLVTLAGALGIIAGAMYLMSGALPGAAALIIVAGALAILTPILQTLGGMDIPTIAMALGTLAAVFAVLGIAGLALAPVVLPLMGLGAAIMLLGAGTALAGVGLLAFSAGLTALAVSGTAGAAALTAIAAAIIGLIPMALKAVGEGLVLLAGVIANAGPTFLAAMTTVMNSMLGAIRNVAPNIVSTILSLIGMLLNKLSVAVPQFVNSGMRLITGVLNGIGANIGRLVTAGANIIVNFLNGIANNIGRVVTAAVNVITSFINAIGNNLGKIIQSGVDLILKFINGITNAIDNNSGTLGTAGGNLAVAIVRGMANGISNGIGVIKDAAMRLARNALDAAKNFLGIHSPSREFWKIGDYVVKGFRNGIDDNRGSVMKSFDTLKNMLTDMRKHAQAEVTKQEAALKKLKDSWHRDPKKIAATAAALAQARKELSASNSAYNNLTRNWTDDRNRLASLTDQYGALGNRIKDANQRLADAKKARDDYAKSVKDQYDNLPDISAETNLQDFANTLRKRISDLNTYQSKLAQLRKIGLNDTLYKEFVSKGTDAMPFLDQLLGTGKSGVTQLNQLSSQLDATANAMGNNTAKALYQAGVDSAAGLVKGLQNQQAAIQKQMNTIANAMVSSIKKSLGIKSPSREFMTVGKFSMQGLSRGLENYGVLAEESAKAVGHDTIEAMRKTISGLDTVVAAGVDMNPTVRPILDLTDIQKNAKKIGTLVGANGLSVNTTYGQAKGASVGYANAQAAATDTVAQTGGPQVTYNQYNNSPKALSSADIYRGTKNQLSTLKGALGT